MTVQRPLQFEFNANRSFSDFYAGSNRETVCHLQQCATGSGEQFIYLWGKAGLGKSHLLQACCQWAVQHAKTSFYLSLDPAGLPDPAILDGLDEFNLVCIDNIDNLAGNTRWEHAFFALFNRQRDRNNRLVVASAVSAKDVAIALPDLKTRLSWGLALKLQVPDEAERLALLSYKAQRLGFDISPQVGQFLLTHYARDLPSLWRMLDTINHETLAAQRKLTIPFLKQILH